MSKKVILASFNKDNTSIDFYEVHSIYNNRSYVLRKQGTDRYYLFMRSIYVLIDLKTTFPPKNEEILNDLTHIENTVDSNCLMFYANSNFVKLHGIWKDKDLIALKNRCLMIKFSAEQAKAALMEIKKESKIHYIKNLLVYYWTIKRQDRKLKRNLKEFKILW